MTTCSFNNLSLYSITFTTVISTWINPNFLNSALTFLLRYEPAFHTSLLRLNKITSPQNKRIKLNLVTMISSHTLCFLVPQLPILLLWWRLRNWSNREDILLRVIGRRDITSGVKSHFIKLENNWNLYFWNSIY